MKSRMPGMRYATSSAWDGAHASASPWVPCAQVTTGRPPGGAFAVGATTTPETATSAPLIDREWYSTFHAREPAGEMIGVAEITSPGRPTFSRLGGETVAVP